MDQVDAGAALGLTIVTRQFPEGTKTAADAAAAIREVYSPTGLVLFGGGSMTLLSGSQIGFAAGLLRVLLAAAYLGCGMAALGAVGLFVSTLTEQPIAATIATVVFSTSSFILDSIPQLGWLHPYLLTHHWLDFGDLFRAPIAWNNLSAGVALAAGYAVVFFLAAWARFAGKDVTS